MKTIQSVQSYDSSTVAYHKAFQLFLDHTDQKAKAKAWLDQLIGRLPAKRVFIDAGAGTGKVTAWFADAFQRTIAAEPNASLRQELTRVCPRAEVLSEMILDASISDKGDFILSSHVFYYIDGQAWLDNLDRLASWLSSEGSLVVVLQNHESDCMKMLQHFLGRSFNLSTLASAFETKNPGRYHISMEAVPCHVTTSDLETAYTVAEFMLNLLPLPQPPPSEDLREYVRKHFTVPDGGYRFSCTQDFLHIRGI